LPAILKTALTVLPFVVAALLIPWIALQKRAPASTLAWIALVLGLPYLGGFLYYVIGYRRVTRTKFKRLRARLGLGAAREKLRGTAGPSSRALLDPRALQLMKLATEVCQIPPSTATRARLLLGGDQALAAIEEAVRAAKHHVHLEYYIFEPDGAGTRLRDLLVERAKAGVEVRLLCDGVGSRKLSRRFLDPLYASGARFAWFSPVRLQRLLRPRLVNFRTHRKIVVVDGRVGFTGGINVTDEESVLACGARAWRDTHFAFEGAAARWLQLVFMEDWSYATGSAPTDAAHFPDDAEEGPIPVQILASGPDEPWQAIHKLYFAAIASARDRVLVATPYFVPDDAMLAALMTAALRGVDVRVLVPRRSDSRFATAAGRSFFGDVLAAGVRVFEYRAGMMHAKTLVVDDMFSAVGTANMDNRSFRLNYEVIAVRYDETGARELAETFTQDLAHAREIGQGALANDKLPSRIFQAGARLLSPLL
jgi:cardiolipin synthase